MAANSYTKSSYYLITTSYTHVHAYKRKSCNFARLFAIVCAPTVKFVARTVYYTAGFMLKMIIVAHVAVVSIFSPLHRKTGNPIRIALQYRVPFLLLSCTLQYRVPLLCCLEGGMQHTVRPCNIGSDHAI